MDYRAEIQKGGRVTIPAVIRKKLNMAEGDIVTIREENGDIKLITQHQALAQARYAFGVCPLGNRWRINI